MKSDVRDFIAKIIGEAVQTFAIYSFGERRICRAMVSPLFEFPVERCETTHFYLFVVARDFGGDTSGNISAQIKLQSSGRYTATVLLHTKRSLRLGGDQRYFYTQVLERGQLLFQNDTPIYLPAAALSKRNVMAAKKYVKQRNMAKEFFLKAEAMDGEVLTIMHIYLLRLVLEQACVAMIRVFLGYVPHQFSLFLLLELCEYFTALPREVFPRDTQRDRALMKILAGHSHLVRSGNVGDVARYDVVLLRERCYEFVARAEVLVAGALERLDRGI